MYRCWIFQRITELYTRAIVKNRNVIRDDAFHVTSMRSLASVLGEIESVDVIEKNVGRETSS